MTTLSIRGVSLFVEVVGQGYPLVLMHGGPSLDYTTLLALKPLADRFTLVFYDHRCNGRSEGADVSSMTLENLTADADALRQALGFEQWAVLGHSFGGNVALEYALRYPQSLSHLILMDTGGDQWWVNQNAPDLLARRGYNASTVQAARRFYNGQFTSDEYTSIAMKLLKPYYYRLDLLGVAREMMTGPHIKHKPEALIFGYSQELNGWTVMSRLGEIHVPTLVLAGRWDFLFPTEHQVALAAGIPGARLEIIECAGHNPQQEQPVETMRIIADFMQNAGVPESHLAAQAG